MPHALLDEIERTFPAARRWFGMVADLEFARARDGALQPRYATLRSPLVHRDEDPRRALVATLPSHADGAHTVALAGEPDISIRVREEGVPHIAAETARGLVIYRGAVAGSDLVYKLTPSHVDEYLYVRAPMGLLTRRARIERGPGVSSLRVTSSTLEVLDANGVAWLRAGFPLARAADGTRRRGTIRLEGDSMVMEVDLRGLVAPILVDPDWAATGSMTVGHWMDAAFLRPSGRVLVVGGCALSGCPPTFAQSACGQVLADTEQWDEPTGTWTAGRPLSTARFGFGSSALTGGDFIVAGGCTAPNCTSVTDRAERFRNASDDWSGAGSLSRARANPMTAALPGGDVLVAGGCDHDRCLTTTDRYRAATNDWVTVAPLGAARGFGTATELADGRVLIVGGCSDPACGTVLGDAEVYDPMGDRWSSAGSMSTARAGHTASRLQDGTVLVVGGCADATCRGTLPTVDIWDGASGGAFRAGPVIPGARHNHTATVLDSGNVLVAGGANGAVNTVPSAVLYAPSQSRWIELEPMHLDRGYHVAVRLPSQNVLLGGGCNTNTCMPWCEVFNPARVPALLADASAPLDATGSDAPYIPPDVALPATRTPHPMVFRSNQTRCANDDTQNLDCPVAGFPLQDPDFQPNTRSWSDGASGEVMDSLSGLVWQAAPGNTTYDHASAIAHCRELATPGAPAGSWRLPNVVELMSIVDYGRHLPSADSRFRDTLPTNYWTASLVASGATQAWTVKFDFGEVIPQTTSRSYPARCVRGPTSAGTNDGAATGHLRAAGVLVAEGVVVRDEANGLEWQRRDDGVRRSWRDALQYCAALNLGGRTGWHAPNVNELRSLVEYGPDVTAPMIDPAFENPRADLYWTSSPNDGAPTLTWSVTFNLGVVDGVTTTGLAFVRCVRHLDVQPPPRACGCRVVGAGGPQAGWAHLAVAVALVCSGRRVLRRRTARSV